MLCLSVADTEPGIPVLESGGVCNEYGIELAHTRKRLSVLYDDRQDFGIE